MEPFLYEELLWFCHGEILELTFSPIWWRRAYEPGLSSRSIRWILRRACSKHNTPRYVYFKTGAKPVIVKSRIVSYIGEEFELSILANPTITPATGTAINPSNLNRINPQATTVTAVKDPTVTDDGTPIEDEPEYYFGGTNNPQRQANSIPPESERIIPANTEFLVKIDGDGRFSYRLEWFEGEPESFDW